MVAVGATVTTMRRHLLKAQEHDRCSHEPLAKLGGTAGAVKPPWLSWKTGFDTASPALIHDTVLAPNRCLPASLAETCEDKMTDFGSRTNG
jgi:hypothetical protein